jgi:putative sterol carrier protein
MEGAIMELPRTPQDIFDLMPGSLDPNVAKGVNATIQFNLEGEDGGQWYVTIREGNANVTRGMASSANMTMSMAARDYVDMNVGKLNPQLAFMSGKLKLSGDMELAMKMQTLFKRAV